MGREGTVLTTCQAGVTGGSPSWHTSGSGLSEDSSQEALTPEHSRGAALMRALELTE